MMPETLTSVMIGAPVAQSHVIEKKTVTRQHAGASQQQAAAQGAQGLQFCVLTLTHEPQVYPSTLIWKNSRSTYQGAPQSTGRRHAGHRLAEFCH